MVLGKVQCGNLLSLLNLLLERLDPALELVNQCLHALVVLAILIRSKAELLDAALRPAQVLVGISIATVLSIKLRLELPDAGLHLVHGLLASLEGIGLSLIQTLLHVLKLALIQLAVLLKGLGHLLFTTELISKTSSINHSLLCLFIGQLSFTAHLIHISMQGLHLRFQLPLGTGNGLVLAGQVRELLVGVGKLLLSHAPGPVSLFQESPGFLKGILHGVGPAVSSNESIPG